MKRTLFSVLFLAFLALCTRGSRQSGEPISIGGLFAITGPASFLGAPEAKAAEMLVAQINAQGGVAGRQLRLLIKDTGGNPEKAISFAKQLIEEEKVFAIIGPSTSGESIKIKSLCDENGTILLSCAAAEVIVNPLLAHVFKTPQKDSDAARKIYMAMKEMGISTIGIMSSNTGFGSTGKEQLEKLAPEYGIQIILSESYDKDATDLTGVITKMKSRNVQAVVNWSIEPAQSIVAKNMRQIGLSVPLFQSHGFGNIRYVKEAGEAAEGVIFPCGRLLVADQLPDDHPQKNLLLKFKKDYEEKYNEEVSSFGGYAYDAILLLQKAIEQSGADRAKTREALENLQGVVGISGIFTLSPQDHNGLSMDSFEMLTVKNGKFTIYQR